MKKIVLSKEGIVTGRGSLAYLKQVSYKKAFLVTGGSSMKRTGVIERVVTYLKTAGCDCEIHDGIGKNPTFEEVSEGLRHMKEYQPDLVLAVGGGSAMDAAKGMLLFYEFPQLNVSNVLEYNKAGKIPATRKTGLICVASTSGTGSEVTRGTVLTDTQNELKIPIMTDCLRPDIAILDGDIVMSMPKKVAAETGMDALTHAMEAYTNHNLDDFDEALCLGAIQGILKELPASVLLEDKTAREKVHNYQAMAGIGFANVGLGMVHGIAHSFGAIFNLAHGLTNAVILPYVLTYNRQDPVVKEKLNNLSYHCHCEDIIEEIVKLAEAIGIPVCFQEAGISEEAYLNKRNLLIEHAMLGATQVNPVKMDLESMSYMVDLVYYGKEKRR